MVLPWLDTARVRSARFRPTYKKFFWVLVIDCIVLGYVGANPPEGWFVLAGRVATAYYFAHFLIVLPILGLIERPLPLPQSISAPVLKPALKPSEGKA
jgi:ubiquinol-cytochrome c reductase cytochrome b subunit